MNSKYTGLVSLPQDFKPVVDLTPEDKRLLEEESFFKNTLGFSASRSQRLSLLTTKFHLNLTNTDLFLFKKSSILKIPAYGEPFLAPKIGMLIYGIFETFLVSGIFLLFSFVLIMLAKTQEQMSIFTLSSAFTLALIGFILIYINTNQKILPYITLVKKGVSFGTVYPAPK